MSPSKKSYTCNRGEKEGTNYHTSSWSSGLWQADLVRSGGSRQLKKGV